jgi:TfoX-like protein
MVHDTPFNLHNITPEIEDWLDKIGVTNQQEFEKIGAKKAYLLMLETGHEPSDELRARLIGAEQDLDWHIIAERDQHRARSRFADVDEP